VGAPARTVGKTPAMAFVLDYVRQFPGADYHRVKAAAQAAGVGVPAPVIYGNALRVVKKETSRGNQPAPAAGPKRRRRGVVRGLDDLAGLAREMQDVLAERDRLRDALDAIHVVIKSLR
jgi:hypothetical protein